MTLVGSYIIWLITDKEPNLITACSECLAGITDSNQLSHEQYAVMLIFCLAREKTVYYCFTINNTSIHCLQWSRSRYIFFRGISIIYADNPRGLISVCIYLVSVWVLEAKYTHTHTKSLEPLRIMCSNPSTLFNHNYLLKEQNTSKTTHNKNSNVSLISLKYIEESVGPLFYTAQFGNSAYCGYGLEKR